MVEVCPICKGAESKSNCSFCGGFGSVEKQPIEGRTSIWKYWMVDRVGGYNGGEDTGEIKINSEAEP